MTKWSKALAVVAIGAAAGLLAPATASAAPHAAKAKHVKIVVADDSSSDVLLSTNSLYWED